MKPKENPLELLEKLVKKKSKEKREHECLKDPERSLTDKDDWFIYVPSCFNDCLDIAKTTRSHGKKPEKNEIKKVWTQGSRFSFHRGSILYDTPKAYEKWGDAIKSINYCISILNGTSAEPAARENERICGNVEFSVLSPCRQTKKLTELGTFSLTQDEFIRFLIEGNPEIIVK
ncbi:MAG: hypothetical protein WC374_09610 [Phycisphaerae bacterium]|jgi:hypothetical protein